MSDEVSAAATVISHPLARETLTTLRDVETEPPAFRRALERLGRVCGHAIVGARFETDPEPVVTPMGETRGERVAGGDEVVLVGILRAAAPFLDGLADAFPAARQGFVAASRDEGAGMDADGRFPIEVSYANLPAIGPASTVIVADPMLATGSTMATVLERLVDGHEVPDALLALSAVSAPAGVERVQGAPVDAEVVTVAVDDGLDEDGFIVPGLGDAGDRAFGT